MLKKLTQSCKNRLRNFIGKDKKKLSITLLTKQH